MMSNQMTFSGSKFSWKGNQGRAVLEDLGLVRFPKSFHVTSPRTGETLRFHPDNEKMERYEFYDGEAYDYIDSHHNVRIHISFGG